MDSSSFGYRRCDRSRLHREGLKLLLFCPCFISGELRLAGDGQFQQHFTPRAAQFEERKKKIETFLDITE